MNENDLKQESHFLFVTGCLRDMDVMACVMQRCDAILPDLRIELKSCIAYLPTCRVVDQPMLQMDLHVARDASNAGILARERAST